MPEGFKAKVDELAGHMFNMMWSLTQMDIESTLGNNQTNKQVSVSVCVYVCVYISFRIFHYYERFFVLFYAVLYVCLRNGMICSY